MTTKVLKIKMRGQHGSGKTEFLNVVACVARRLGMETRLEADGHNMAVISTSEQRIALFDLNRTLGGARQLLESEEAQ